VYEPAAEQEGPDVCVHSQSCRLPPAGTEKYAGAGQKVCRCPVDFKADVNCSVTCDGGVGNACSGHGECIYASTESARAGTCECEDEWVGLAGSQCSATCVRGLGGLVCSGRGECTPTGVAEAHCKCMAGYRGTACEVECKGGAANPCSGHGTCLADGSCSCQDSWRTEDCSIGCPGRIGYLGSVACNARGTCTDAGFCECDTSWRGLSCDIACPAVAGAEGTPCAGNGICNDEGVCLCNRGFSGRTCDIECKGGSQNPCNGHGNCRPDGSCACFGGWVGTSCNILCPGGEDNTCSGRGTCFADGEYAKCKCSEYANAVVQKYMGHNCEVAVYNQQIRDENETKMDKEAIIFARQANWPVFVSPIVVLGLGVVAVALQAVFRYIDKKIAEAKDHEEAIRKASMQGMEKVQRKAALRRAGSTRSMRDFSNLPGDKQSASNDVVTLAEARVSLRCLPTLMMLVRRKAAVTSRCRLTPSAAHRSGTGNLHDSKEHFSYKDLR